MVRDGKKIYFVMKEIGNCKIYEINPSDDTKAVMIAEIKSD